jgi:hypothetical protein
MADVAQTLLPIDLRLRFALFGLECALGVPFSGAECERVFQDAESDSAPAGSYTFFQSAHLSVTGRVEDYEPETIWVEIRGARGDVSELLARVSEGAEIQVFRLNRSLER